MVWSVPHAEGQADCHEVRGEKESFIQPQFRELFIIIWNILFWCEAVF